MLYYYNAQRYCFVIVLSIFSDFFAADAVFRPFRAKKCPLGLKSIDIKALEMTLPESKIVKMGYANMLSIVSFIGLSRQCFWFTLSIQGSIDAAIWATTLPVFLVASGPTSVSISLGQPDSPSSCSVSYRYSDLSTTSDR
jgi:hypothetical protein